MAKYLDKSKLPQYNIYKPCNGKDTGYNITPNETFSVSLKVGEFPAADMTFVDEEIDFNSAEEDAEFIDEYPDDLAYFDIIFAKWERAGWMYEFAVMIIEHLFFDDNLIAHWKDELTTKYKRIYSLINGEKKSDAKKQEAVSDYLWFLDNLLTMANRLQICQGMPLRNEDNINAAPKLILIDSKIYQKYKDETPDIDISYLVRNMQPDEVIVLAINGDCAEKKMLFDIYCGNNGGVIEMVDPRNGVSSFGFVSNMEDDDKRMGGISPLNNRCHPRGDYDCIKDKKTCRFKKTKDKIICECQHKMLKNVVSVLHCYIEYRKQIESEEYKAPLPKKETVSGGEMTKPFVPKGLIRMYDIDINADKLIRTNKFERYTGRSSYTSTEKCPHTRRGFWRYNPRTGKKDIKVRGSIIHKDKYEGFVSCEKIVEGKDEINKTL